VLNQLSKLLSLPAGEVHRQLSEAMRRTRPRPYSELRNAGPGETVAERHETESKISAEQEAYRQIVEVLLNEPEYFAAVGDLLDPALIRDPDLSVVALKLIALLRSEDHFRLVDLMGCFDSPEYGGLITDLAARGECRGKYAETIEWALECLRVSGAARQTVRLVDQVLGGQKEDERLQALAVNAKNPHFASARARRRHLD
jgi:hypothetical protein